jgi:thioredoxin-like negative regulator of GroEL
MSRAKYQVEGIPTLLFFKEGRLVERLLGRTSKEKISRVLDSMLAP